MNLKEQLNDILEDFDVGHEGYDSTFNRCDYLITNIATDFAVWLYENTYMSTGTDDYCYTLMETNQSTDIKELFELFKKENNL